MVKLISKHPPTISSLKYTEIKVSQDSNPTVLVKENRICIPIKNRKITSVDQIFTQVTKTYSS